jgi:hypothetical protein
MSSRSSEMYLPHCITCCSHTFSSWFCVISVDLGTFLRKTWFQQRKPMAPSYCCRYTRRLTTSFTVLYTTVLTDRRMRKNPGAGLLQNPTHNSQWGNARALGQGRSSESNPDPNHGKLKACRAQSGASLTLRDRSCWPFRSLRSNKRTRIVQAQETID